jgi:hypothetical protein
MRRFARPSLLVLGFILLGGLLSPTAAQVPGKAEAAVGVPKAIADLQPGTANYKTVMQMGDQSMEMTFVSAVKEAGGTWVITETVSSAMGEAVSELVVEKGTLAVRKRSMSQGPMGIKYEIKDGKLTGSMSLPNGTTEISLDAAGELFDDGSTAHQSLAVLPLADGYTTAYRTFDVLSQKVQVAHLKVLGSEPVTVAAGTFDTYKVEVTLEDGMKMTTWITKEQPRKMAKTTVTSPRFNGASMTTELVK